VHSLTPIAFSDPALDGHVGIAARPVWRSSNLPAQVSSFVGREREIGAIKQLLQTTHLLALTGAGGVGKTRLALEVAGQLDPGPVDPMYTDGIWLVELAPLTDGALLPRAVASSLGVREISGEPVLETVISWLHPRNLLIILDNCEHLVAACAAIAEALLAPLRA
jgi:predicted ATPase